MLTGAFSSEEEERNAVSARDPAPLSIRSGSSDGSSGFCGLLRQSTSRMGVQGLDNISDAQSYARRIFWTIFIVIGIGKSRRSISPFHDLVL